MASDAVSRHDERQLLGRLVHIEGELGTLDRQVAHANRLASLGTITGIIAHELNNILTPVMSYAQLALANPDDEQLVHKALQRAFEGSERASHIVSAILGFVRDTDQREDADVAHALQEAMRCLARDPHKDGFELVSEIEPNCRVAIAPVLLAQILMNLILNAYQAMSRGKGKLVIKAWRDGDAYITVQDNGCGIDPEHVPGIFEPFVTYRNRPNAGESGTGLGLTACQRILEEVGGRISVESTVGEGTVFTIQLPVSKANGEHVEHQAPKAANRDVA
ncbi:MAG: hypothetical protein KAS72_14355 [Phycisphaerales bacterium]|nr:hypothetical protein [Phycisphaerales bacterium]